MCLLIDHKEKKNTLTKKKRTKQNDTYNEFVPQAQIWAQFCYGKWDGRFMHLKLGRLENLYILPFFCTMLP